MNDPFLWIILTVMTGVSFAVTWRKLGETRSFDHESEETRKLLGVEYQRGFDGKQYLKPLPLFLRFTYSLFTALLGAAISAFLFVRLLK